jgi:phage tail-like protein
MDPYKNFRYRLWMDGRYVYGGAQFRGATPNLISIKLPGRTKWESITLERGVTRDSAFHNWANSVSKGAASSAQVPPLNFRKDIYLEIFNEAGQLLQTYHLTRSWVSQYKSLPALGSNGNEIAIEHIQITPESLELTAPRPHSR